MPGHTGESVIAIDGLSRHYGQRVGIEQLTLEVPAGALFGFLGPNGSGKTTTIRVLLGFMRPSAGRATVMGLDCWRASHRIKEHVGYLPGDLRLYSALRGSELLGIAGLIRGRDLAAAGRELAGRFDLDLGVRIGRMSRGMRQKLGLILALAPRPRLLILDEPTASLDPLMQEALLALLRELAAQGHTVFFSSHSLPEVEQLCDRVAILREGSLVADERLEDLRKGATRQVRIQWARGAAVPEVPEHLEACQRRGWSWEARLRGPVGPFLRWAAGQPIEDLVLGQPDLEQLFRDHYRQAGR